MRFRSSGCLLLTGIILLVPGAAQQAESRHIAPMPFASHSQSTSRVPEAGISAEASLVNLNVQVSDEDGGVISGLKEENFRVLDNGVPQQISRCAPSSAPITIVMLLEYSAAGYSYYASKAAAWAASFLDELEPEDRVALVTYDLISTVRVDFTHNRTNIRDSLGSLGAPTFREANVFDAVIESLDTLERVNGRKSILLLSTGAHTFGVATFDDLMKRLRTSDVTIFSVGLAEDESTPNFSPNPAYLQARSWLQTLSDQTGGIARFPRFSSELPDVFRSITGFLRNEYTISFSPNKGSGDGGYHRLTVEVIRPEGKPLTAADEKGRERKPRVICRPGYMAPTAPAAQDTR